MRRDEDRFRCVHTLNFEPLLAYAIRRVEQPVDAADVVAEVFLIAWRRRREMPPGDEARRWLYGVARRVLANHHRGAMRRERLGERLRQRLGADPGSAVPEQRRRQGGGRKPAQRVPRIPGLPVTIRKFDVSGRATIIPAWSWRCCVG